MKPKSRDALEIPALDLDGAATLAALRKLLDAKWLDRGETVLPYNTGTGLKYPELIELPQLEILPKNP